MTNIRLANGKTIKATIINKIDNDGNQYSVAVKGTKVYRVVSRDFDGAIWA